jgi:hypothetical protein
MSMFLCQGGTAETARFGWQEVASNLPRWVSKHGHWEFWHQAAMTKVKQKAVERWNWYGHGKALGISMASKLAGHVDYFVPLDVRRIGFTRHTQCTKHPSEGSQRRYNYHQLSLSGWGLKDLSVQQLVTNLVR